MMMVQRIRIMLVVMVTFVLLTNLATRAAPRKMSGWDFPRRQTETGKTPILLTYYHQVGILLKLPKIIYYCRIV